MKIDLDRMGFIHLLSGTEPDSGMVEVLEKEHYGYMEDGSWVWDKDILRRMTCADMRQLYMQIWQAV